MRQTMLFQWRNMDSVPRDGTPFVHLGFCTYLFTDRPAALVPILSMLQMVHFTSARFCERDDIRSAADTGLRVTTAPGERDGSGCWNEVRYDHSMDGRTADAGQWMYREEYTAAAGELGKTWDRIPEDRPGFASVKTPLVFVRPIEPRVRYDFSKDVLEAEIVWRAPLGWASAKSNRDGCHPGFLNGDNCNTQAFRWCQLDDFVPAEVLAEHEACNRRIAELRASSWLEANR